MENSYEETEDKKYSHLYKEGYGLDIPIRLKRLVRWLSHVTDTSNRHVVDLGCGNAGLMKLLDYKSYTGIDISTFIIHRNKSNYQRSDNNIKFLQGNVERLPFDNSEFGIAFCTDVMEHIPTDKIDRVLKECFRVAETVIFTIACGEAKHTDEHGGELHLTQRSPNWWREKLEKLTDVREEIIFGDQVTYFCGKGYNPLKYGDDPNFNIRIRQKADGAIWIPRNHKEAEKYLDVKYQRINNQLLWYPRISPPENIMQLTNMFKDMTCTIVGKGPSLDYLSEFDFEGSDHPIICLNESIHQVEKIIPATCRKNLYVLQQDTGIDCKPKYAKLLLHNQIKHLYSDIQKRYLFNDASFNYSSRQLSVIVAIKIAKLMGCDKLHLISFDASVNGKTDYAKVIGVSPVNTMSGGAERFLKHRKRILQAAKLTPIKWITPEDHT